MADINALSLSNSLVDRLNSLSGAVPGSLPATAGDAETSFADILSESLALTEDAGRESNGVTLDLLSGNIDDLSTALIATEKATIALNLTVAIRNKAVDAYKEIMSMQV